MTTELPYILINKSQLFRVSVTELDGVTVATPTGATCTVCDADDNEVITDDGVVGLGYAQYNWEGTDTAGNYRAVLEVTMSGGVVISHDFTIEVKAQPPAFTVSMSTDIGKLRFRLDDTEIGYGVKPRRRNFTDEELQYFLDNEDSIELAEAAACETLSTMWTRFVDTSVGQRSEGFGSVADKYAKRAEKIRAEAAGVVGGFGISIKRVDGYSAR